MNIEIFGLVGFSLATIAMVTMAYRRRMDVLYESSVQGRPPGFSVKRFWQPASSAIDRFSELAGPKMVLGFVWQN
jgi:hypothetical protein